MITDFSLLANHMTNHVLKILQEVPGNAYLGPKVIKHKIAAPAGKDEIRLHFRAAIERNLNQKWRSRTG